MACAFPLAVRSMTAMGHVVQGVFRAILIGVAGEQGERMPAYMIVHVSITDPEKYREYTRHTPRIIAAHGGRFIVRGGESVTLEGEPSQQRVVVVEFPSLE